MDLEWGMVDVKVSMNLVEREFEKVRLVFDIVWEEFVVKVIFLDEYVVRMEWELIGLGFW